MTAAGWTKRPDNTPGFVRLWLEPCPSVTDAAAVASGQHETPVSSRGTVAAKLGVNSKCCYGCLLFPSQKKKTAHTRYFGGPEHHHFRCNLGFVGSLERGVIRNWNRSGCNHSKDEKGQPLHHSSLVKRKVSENSENQRGPLFKICGFKKTENTIFFSSFVSWETHTPSRYQKAESLGPLHCLSSLHPSSISFSFHSFFVFGEHVQITGAS